MLLSLSVFGLIQRVGSSLGPVCMHSQSQSPGANKASAIALSPPGYAHWRPCSCFCSFSLHCQSCSQGTLAIEQPVLRCSSDSDCCSGNRLHLQVLTLQRRRLSGTVQLILLLHQTTGMHEAFMRAYHAVGLNVMTQVLSAPLVQAATATLLS